MSAVGEFVVAADLRPLLYVCIVSNFNLPEFESCLVRRPACVLLVASRGYEGKAALLENGLKQALGDTVVEVIGCTADGALRGDELASCHEWVRRSLRPRLQRAQAEGMRCGVNFTGGTKPLALAVYGAWDWDMADYLSSGQQSLQSFRPSEPGEPRYGRVPLIGASALQVARLYAPVVSQSEENRVIQAQPEQTLSVAKAIWHAQEAGDAALATLFEALERVWFGDDALCKLKSVSLGWKDFLGEASMDSGVRAWMTRFAALAPDVLACDSSGVCLPGRRAKGAGRDVRDWIGGVWLEQLVRAWLIEDGLAPREWAFNLRVGDEAADSARLREADVLVHRHNLTWLVEIKAGIPPNHKPSELRKQVESLGDRFGQTRKALLVGPAIRRQLPGRAWQDFETSCAAARVALCTDHSSLRAFLGLAGGVGGAAGRAALIIGR